MQIVQAHVEPQFIADFFTMLFRRQFNDFFYFSSFSTFLWHQDILKVIFHIMMLFIAYGSAFLSKSYSAKGLLYPLLPWKLNLSRDLDTPKLPWKLNLSRDERNNSVISVPCVVKRQAQKSETPLLY
jgi:hypothetical protein